MESRCLHFVFAVLYVATVCAMTEEEGSLQSMQLKEGKLGKRALDDKMEVVSDLNSLAARLRKNRAKERRKKAQAAVTYMEEYKATKAGLDKEGARLRDRLERDKMEILKATPGLRKAHERGKKHDRRIKETMRHAIIAMKKVDNLVSGKQKADPTVKAARKAVNKVNGKQIFTVLGLDANQLGKDYLLAMDAAVAAYDAKPTHQAFKKVQASVNTAKERMKKDQVLERQKKSEVRSKKERSEKNKTYYKQKWSDKKRELKRKRIKRDKFVAKLKTENKHKAWVRRKNEDEIEAKNSKLSNEKRAKINKVKKIQERKAKVVLAKAKIKARHKAKLKAKLHKLTDIVVAKKSDAMKKSIELKRAVEKTAKAKQSMERQSKNVNAAGKIKRSAAVAYGKSNELKTKTPSELNVKTVTKAQAYMRNRAALSRAEKFKETASKSTMKERERKKALARLAKKAANAVKLKAIKKAALYKASMGAKQKRRGTAPKRVRRAVARRRVRM